MQLPLRFPILLQARRHHEPSSGLMMLMLLLITLLVEIILLGALDGLDWLNLPILFVAFAIVFFCCVVRSPSPLQLSSTHSEQVLVSLGPLSINYVDMKFRESHKALVPQESGVSVHLVHEDEKDSTMRVGGRYHAVIPLKPRPNSKLTYLHLGIYRPLHRFDRN